jgi:adenylate cyclase
VDEVAEEGSVGIEIERKFLVNGNAWKEESTGVLYRQGYLSTDKDRVVRVRTMGNRAALTVKGAPKGLRRLEFEYEIPLDDAEQLLDLCENPLIEKTRYRIEAGRLTWEVDDFHGLNQGLVIAECELETEDQVVEKPEWVGEEVTDDPRYYNSHLVLNPFTTW